MTVIKTTDSIEELEAVKEMVSRDIARWRTKDTGGSDGIVLCMQFCFPNFYVLILSQLTRASCPI